jgi:hypothetical protein
VPIRKAHDAPTLFKPAQHPSSLSLSPLISSLPVHCGLFPTPFHLASSHLSSLVLSYPSTPSIHLAAIMAPPRGSTGSTYHVIRFLVLGLARAAPLQLLAEGDDEEMVDGPGKWAYLGTAIALVLLGGAFAGLTIAYAVPTPSSYR